MEEQEEKSYLRLARAYEIKNKKDRRIYRFFEILPGALALITFLVFILASKFFPVYVSIFLIVFVVFWLFRSAYYLTHLISSYHKMKQYEKINWQEKLEKIKFPINTLPTINSLDELYHLIILPTYKEPYEIVKESLDSLVNSGYNPQKLIVVLATEERAKEQGAEIRQLALKDFNDKFFRFFVTIHPADIPGEIAGKGSNEAWAGKQVVKEIIDPLKIPYENVIVSVFDIDTLTKPGFFQCLAYHYLTAQDPLHSSYQPLPIYTNNIWEAPAVARILSFSSTFWQMIQQARPESLITFSSHSMGLKPVVEIGFWQENVVSEDSRIFYQCFLHYNGNWQVVPLYYPVYMDANISDTLIETLKNQYKQQRRWGYGAENIPYLFFGFIKNKKIPFKLKLHYGFNIIEGFYSWSVYSILISCGWLPSILGGKEFSFTVLSYNLPQLTSKLLTIAMLGLLGSAYLSVALLPQRPKNLKKSYYFLMVFQWLLSPVLVFLSAIPALDASIRLMLGKYMGFWVTPKSR